jgi:hypothetical protein
MVSMYLSIVIMVQRALQSIYVEGLQGGGTSWDARRPTFAVYRKKLGVFDMLYIWTLSRV